RQIFRKPIEASSANKNLMCINFASAAGQIPVTYNTEMTHVTLDHVRRKMTALYRAGSRRVFATLVRMLVDFDLAEEALHDAFTSAMKQWPEEGIPENPRAW